MVDCGASPETGNKDAGLRAMNTDGVGHWPRAASKIQPGFETDLPPKLANYTLSFTLALSPTLTQTWT